MLIISSYQGKLHSFYDLKRKEKKNPKPPKTEEKCQGLTRRLTSYFPNKKKKNQTFLSSCHLSFSYAHEIFFKVVRRKL